MRPAKRAVRAKSAADTAAIEASLAGIAHDVRTPLTGILALAELLSSSDLGERERQWAVAIKSGAEHLAALTTLIVDAVKSDAKGLVLRRETFPPRRLAEAVGEEGDAGDAVVREVVDIAQPVADLLHRLESFCHMSRHATGR